MEIDENYIDFYKPANQFKHTKFMNDFAYTKDGLVFFKVNMLKQCLLFRKNNQWPQRRLSLQ